MRLIFFIVALGWSINAFAQSPEKDKLEFEGDFRFRVEHDWNSHRPDGSLRDDRSRLRYRIRFGFTYEYNAWASFGARVRSGNLNDQQGPHLTLGEEFSTVDLGFEKLYFQAKHKSLSAWIGKNTFPFFKQHELFWNDNVFPDGASITYNIIENPSAIGLKLIGGHFIITPGDKDFGSDDFFEGIQMLVSVKDRIKFAPAIYYFNHVPNIPDDKGTYDIKYSLLHFGAEAQVDKGGRFLIGGDIYHNTANLNLNDSIPDQLTDQRTGYVINAKYGTLSKKGDWTFQLYYAHLQKFSVVDYFAQNDWARWDFSSIGASGSRLSNFMGIEYRIGYAFGPKFDLIFRGYYVKQLEREGRLKEDGSRVRLDLNIGF